MILPQNTVSQPLDILHSMCCSNLCVIKNFILPQKKTLLTPKTFLPAKKSFFLSPETNLPQKTSFQPLKNVKHPKKMLSHEKTFCTPPQILFTPKKYFYTLTYSHINWIKLAILYFFFQAGILLTNERQQLWSPNLFHQLEQFSSIGDILTDGLTDRWTD